MGRRPGPVLGGCIRALAFVIVALVAPTATVARADGIPVYTVYGCEAPGGAGAGLDGWAFSLAATHPILDNRCRSGGPLRAGLDRRFAHGRNDTVEAIFTSKGPRRGGAAERVTRPV